MITGNEPAIGIPATVHEAIGTCEPFAKGLTIRQEFAARAMQALLSNNESMPSIATLFKVIGLPKDTVYRTEHYMQYNAVFAVIAADALIAELNK